MKSIISQTLDEIFVYNRTYTVPIHESKLRSAGISNHHSLMQLIRWFPSALKRGGAK